MNVSEARSKLVDEIMSLSPTDRDLMIRAASLFADDREFGKEYTRRSADGPLEREALTAFIDEWEGAKV